MKFKHPLNSKKANLKIMAKKSSPESEARKECKFYVKTSVKDFKNSILWHMERSLARATVRATPRDWWLATAMAVRDEIMGRFISTMSRQYKANSKRVYYLSLEYLMGRLTEDTLTNSGLMDIARGALKELDLDFDSIMASEVDMGLGNGGLGRLAAVACPRSCKFRRLRHSLRVRAFYAELRRRKTDRVSRQLA